MIENLNLKLEGKEPITRIELFELVSSWGRKEYQITKDKIKIENCFPKECYYLSNLDVSLITDFSKIFRYSLYNGDLSKWNTKSCTNMNRMFSHSNFNNDSLNSWNLSNVTNMDFIFYNSKFNGDISNWNIFNVINFDHGFGSSKFDGNISKWNFNKNVSCIFLFEDNESFKKKYNDGEKLPFDSNSFLIWFKKNRENISNLNISKEDDLDMEDYLNTFDFQIINNKDN